MQYMKRSPVAVLLLSIVTCGLYQLYLVYQITTEIRDFRGEPALNPLAELLLCIVTCGLYELYWFYKYGRLVFDMQQRVGVDSPSDLSLVLLLLPIFGFAIVSFLLIQAELNRVWDAVSPRTNGSDETLG